MAFNFITGFNDTTSDYQRQLAASGQDKAQLAAVAALAAKQKQWAQEAGNNTALTNSPTLFDLNMTTPTNQYLYGSKDTPTALSGYKPTAEDWSITGGADLSGLANMMQQKYDATDWSKVVNDPSNVLFGQAVKDNLEGLTSENVSQYLLNEIKKQTDYAATPTFGVYNGGGDNKYVPAMLLPTGGPFDPQSVTNTQIGSILDWFTDRGYTDEQLKPYYNAANAPNERMYSGFDDQYTTANVDNSKINYGLYEPTTRSGEEQFVHEASPLITMGMGSLMSAMGGLAGLAGAPALASTVLGTVGGMAGSAIQNPDAKLGEIAIGGAKGLAGGLVGGLSSGLDISGNIGDMAFNAGLGDLAANTVGNTVGGAINGLASGAIKGGLSGDLMGGLASGALSGAVGGATSSADDMIADVFKDAGLSPTYANALADAIAKGSGSAILAGMSGGGTGAAIGGLSAAGGSLLGDAVGALFDDKTLEKLTEQIGTKAVASLVGSLFTPDSTTSSTMNPIMAALTGGTTSPTGTQQALSYVNQQTPYERNALLEQQIFKPETIALGTNLNPYAVTQYNPYVMNALATNNKSGGQR